MITIIGHVKVRPGRVEAFERLFRDYAARVKANEPGALVYQLGRSRADPCAYKVIEIYRDAAALAEHRAAAYFQPAVEAIAACLDGAATPEFFDVVE
jgi:quinol monooxygenase YgiN